MDLLYLCGKAICTPHQIYFGDQKNEDEMGREQRCKWDLMVNLEERDSRLFRNIDIFHHCESLATRMERITSLQICAFWMHCEKEFVAVQERLCFGSHNLCYLNFFKANLVSLVVGETWGLEDLHEKPLSMQTCFWNRVANYVTNYSHILINGISFANN